jgi:preprotein translocase SecE subunit
MNRIKFVADLQAEFKKVTWLDKPQLIFQSKIVLISILVIGFMVAANDVVLQATLSFFSWLLKWIIG